MPKYFLSLLLILPFVATGVSTRARVQEKFKGSVDVFVRAPRKSHTARRPNVDGIPGAAIAANRRGNAHFDAKRYEEAIAAHQKAIEIYSQYAEAYVNLGDDYKELERYQEAVVAYQEAIKLKPNYGDAHYGLSYAYQGLGRYNEAEEARRRALAIFGGDQVLNERAITLGTPTYPAIAKSVRASGRVQVRVLIDGTGRVIRAEAISGHPLLRAVSVKAASESVFPPGIAGGHETKVSGLIVYNFPPPP